MGTVSVITPVYNVEDYIVDTVQSVLNQTYPDFEYLIIDDGSPDGSIKKIKQTFDDPRIQIIHQENQGANAARNNGIRHAKGDYIAFLDADDQWLPEKLEKHVEHLERSPQLGISYSCSAFIDEHGEQLGIYQIPKLSDITIGDVICRNPISNGSCAVFRKDVFDAIKFEAQGNGGQPIEMYWDENLQGSQDIDCWFRMVLQTNWTMAGIPDLLTLYRVNSQGISANLMKKQASWEQVIEKTRQYAPDVVAQYERPARAYHLRYLARRAVSLRDSRMAVQLFNQSVAAHWKMLVEEPSRTLLTGGAAYLLWLLPERLYQSLEKSMMGATGAQQQRQMKTDSPG